MAQIVEYKVGEQAIFVETEDPAKYGEQAAGFFWSSDTPKPDLLERLESLMPSIDKVLQQVSKISVVPEEISLELGIKFVGETGIVIAKAGTEAALTLSFKWNPRASK